jgi:succinate dehydrogenase/fumarate reductase flavoprotein subunit
MAANTYDAIIVGSGITGGWAAKELGEKGAANARARSRDVRSIPTRTMSSTCLSGKCATAE